MKETIRKIYTYFLQIGIDPKKFFYFVRGFPLYIINLREFKRQIKKESIFKIGRLYPILDEKSLKSGTSSGHYFHQDLLVARMIYKNNPLKHVDIGSRIDGFVAHVASFREIEIFDIRPQENNIENMIFKQLDLMENLSFDLWGYCDSISSLHAVEHFGLGRYGDCLDVNGHLKGLENIYKMLKKRGKFYFSVPIGSQRVEFNAHRVFSVKYLINIFKDKYSLDTFSFVDDKGNLFINAKLDDEKVNSNFGCHYGCGIFEMTKI